MRMRVFCQTILMAALLTGCVQAEKSPTINSPSEVAAAVATQLAGLPTFTVAPSATPETPTPTDTPSPTIIPPTQTVSPTGASPFPYITWTPSTCDYSAFIADLDITDYSKRPPRAPFLPKYGALRI